jgi:hypothetical protein
MATDFRDGKSFPRRGRDEIGGYLWLLRVADKGRAALAGTIHDYVYPCPMDKGVFERWGITPEQFHDALKMHASDQALLEWLNAHAIAGGRVAANCWLSDEKELNLDRQDAEEGVVAA